MAIWGALLQAVPAVAGLASQALEKPDPISLPNSAQAPGFDDGGKAKPFKEPELQKTDAMSAIDRAAMARKNTEVDLDRAIEAAKVTGQDDDTLNTLIQARVEAAKPKKQKEEPLF